MSFISLTFGSHGHHKVMIWNNGFSYFYSIILLQTLCACKPKRFCIACFTENQKHRKSFLAVLTNSPAQKLLTYLCISTGWHNHFVKHQLWSHIWITWLEVCCVQFHLTSGCLGKPCCCWWWWFFCVVSPPFSGRTGTSAALSARRGKGRCRREDLARCWGWWDRSIGDRWGKWSARIHTAPRSIARTQICIPPRGGRAQTQQWSWRWSRPGCPQFCAARGRRGKEIFGGSRQCALRCT